MVCRSALAGIRWNMSESNQEPDPLDEEAAEIDPRSPEAVEDIEELIEHSEELGRDPDQEVTGEREPS
jgi:hypothetical protein